MSRTFARLIRSQATGSAGGGIVVPQTGFEPALHCLKGSCPALDDCGVKLVDLIGFEPMTPALPRQCSSAELQAHDNGWIMSGTTDAETLAKIERERLIKNEQTKLMANAIDRASTGIGISSLFPLWQIYSGTGNRPLLFAASAYIFLFAAFVLHLVAHQMLRRLR
jgi:hypothetical protein